MSSRRLIAVLAIFGALLGTACDRGGSPAPQGEGDTEKHDEDEHGEHGEAGHEEEGSGLVELSAAMADRVRIRSEPVRVQRFAAELSTTGTVDFDRDRVARVAARIPGRVDRVAAELGQRVNAGDTLAVLDSIELGTAKSEFLQAKSKLALARADLEREEQLFEREVTSERDLQAARAGFQDAEAAFNAAADKLRLLGISDREIEGIRYGDPGAAKFTLRAPFAGKVIERDLTRGELVTPERNLFTIGDLSTVWVWIDVYERDLSRVHLTDDVEVRADAFPERVYSGTVSYVRDQVDPDTRTVRARVDVRNEDGALRPGMFVRVLLSDPHVVGTAGAGTNGAAAVDGSPVPASKEDPPTLVVPESALQREGDGFVVFVEIGPRRYERRAVVLGDKANGRVEVLSGLAEGERVVTEGAFLLKSEAEKGAMGGGHSH